MLEQAVTNKHVLYHAECTIPTYQSNLRASSISYTVEPRYCEHNAVCRYYRGIRISEVSGIFPVGVASILVLLSATKARSRAPTSQKHSCAHV